MNRRRYTGVNQRWHRADLSVSPLGCLLLTVIALSVLAIALVAS